ncbi:MAG TPA: response regulator transcription factor, partial [Acidimicrobiales bacterium]|nr:response regulator transcription factor [Acidimicrobiales bacterium]
ARGRQGGNGAARGRLARIGRSAGPGMRVVIADDQRVVREGLATIVGAFAGVEVVGLAADGAEAVELTTELAPDVVLMDLRMPRMDGVEATRLISEVSSARVVVLTTYADDESVLAALAAGAKGYLTKGASKEDIRRALEAAVAGQAILDTSVQSALVNAARSRPVRPATLPDGLTDREAEVLGLIAQGLSNAEIAERLFVAESTVKTHINRVFAKTGSRDRAQAAAYAHRNGLTS